ncbi:MAG: FAD-dependent oxidoreductase [Bacilli bacterium]|jgi:thioredoxin reductase (NADPH)|nr:FAD-dependent oxidoreductase [Bacilli bacterium]
MYDLIIIGMGISGISAAIYAKRANLKVLMIESSAPGGTLNKITNVENYPGISSVSGPDFAFNLFTKVQELEIEYKIEEVTDIITDSKTIKTKNNVYQAKNILIATGRRPKLLGLDKEEALLGRGISTCALCDGALYKNKEVAVIGGGSSALAESIHLSKLVKKVYLIHRREEFRGEDTLVEEVKNTNNIELILNNEIKELKEENNILSGLILKDGQELNVSALFIYIGFIPNTSFIENSDIKLDKGYILVDKNGATNIDGIYASGDVTKKDTYQLINAASEGALASIKISENI